MEVSGDRGTDEAVSRVKSCARVLWRKLVKVSEREKKKRKKKALT